MSDTASTSVDVSDITTTCQMVVDNYLAGKIELVAISDNLRAIVITPEEAQDYCKQITQHFGKKGEHTTNRT